MRERGKKGEEGKPGGQRFKSERRKSGERGGGGGDRDRRRA